MNARPWIPLLLTLVALMAVGGAPLAAQGDRVQSGVGPGSVILEPGGLGSGRALIEIVGRGEATFELPVGSQLLDVWQLEDGWLASGRQPDGDASDMLVLRGAADGGAQVLTPPEPRRHRMRGGATPFLAGGKLVGLAWLQGDTSTGSMVRAAAWEDGSWGPVEVVSEPGPGSQTALTAAVLADGSWVLAWAAYDGDDDEIVWSRREGGVWSRPERVTDDNETPDIMPSIVAAGSGAILSWSWMDGSDYRLKLAVLRGDRWREIDFLGGRGSLFPSFFESGDGLQLLFRTVEPASWTMLELDVNGRIWRRAVLAEPSRERPVVDEIGAARVRFRWPAWRGRRGLATDPQAAGGGERPADRRAAAEWQAEP